MPDSTDHPHYRVDMTRVGRLISKLHDQVAGRRQRVEITRAGCDDTCVMISRTELESLERALAILADTDEFHDMSQSLKHLLNTAGVVYGPQALNQAETTLNDIHRAGRFSG